MTRNDATAMNHLCHWIASPGAAEINYHGLQPQSRLGPAPEPLPSRASLRMGKLDSCRFLSTPVDSSPHARGPSRTRPRSNPRTASRGRGSGRWPCGAKKYFHGLERPFPGSPNFSVNTSYGVLSSRTPHVIRYKDVLKWLKIHSRTLDYYIQRGYLKRVYGGGERAIGVSRDSYLKFIARRSGR